MYTKEDIGTEVHLPSGSVLYIGARFNKRISPALFELEEEGRPVDDLYMDANGHEVSTTEHRFSAWPVFSRAPYTPGEPFVCVVERPYTQRSYLFDHLRNVLASGPLHPSTEESQLDALAEHLEESLGEGCKCGDETTGETSFMLCNICGLTPAKTDKEQAEETDRLCGVVAETPLCELELAGHSACADTCGECEQIGGVAESVDKYPSVGESGKIRVTPEQSAAVQKVLIEKGYSWMGSGCKVSNTDKPILCWNSKEITYADDCDSDCVGYGAMIHTIADFYAPAFEGPIEALPFTQKDVGVNIEDQAGTKFKVVKRYNDDGPCLAAYRGGDSVDCPVELDLKPDGTTATALVFTRTRSNQ